MINTCRTVVNLVTVIKSLRPANDDFCVLIYQYG